MLSALNAAQSKILSTHILNQLDFLGWVEDAKNAFTICSDTQILTLFSVMVAMKLWMLYRSKAYKLRDTHQHED